MCCPGAVNKASDGSRPSPGKAEVLRACRGHAREENSVPCLGDDGCIGKSLDSLVITIQNESAGARTDNVTAA
jgi:hypothetical protein